MSDPVPDPTPADLPRVVLVALLQVAERAVSTINTGLTIQFTQPVQPPVDAEVFLQQLILIAANPVMGLWDAIEPADLRSAGRHLALALLRELASASAGGLAKIRQFTSQPPAAESASPAPGAGPQ